MSSVLVALGCQAESTPAVPGGNSDLPVQWLGDWQVSSVHIDGETSRRLGYQQDDPRLVGRRVRVTATEITFGTPEHDRCREPRVRRETLEAGVLIASNLPGSKARTPADFGLPFPDSARLNVVWVSCSAGSAGPEGDPAAAASDWWFQSGAQLYLRGYDGTILALSSVPEGTRAQPSFDCAKARSPTEQALCGSAELAAYDRSIATAFASRLQFLAEIEDRAGAETLRIAQRAWLTARDACGTRSDCLTREMEARLEALAEPRDD
ncbi:lysozyme inhibitor LprI family protein [Nevskia sp.]|uniref:lysozyme inhibitor LprI family protein n=1 Tax=Nevskia sp. TaxID=1929292 RepID=UPI002600E53D|nr:lysozyme inhibitor LprI family protein [Nevskia sp.]